MREVFTHKEFTRVGHYQSILEAEGIPSFIKNGSSHNVIAEIPVPFLYPVLCVENDADYERAIEILRAVYKPEKTDQPDWTCASCTEVVPGTFDSCWKCGADAGEKPVEAAVVPSVAAAPVAAAEPTAYHRAVGTLRLMIVGMLVVEAVFFFGSESLYERLNLYPPNAFTGVASIVGMFNAVFGGIALVMCFGLARIGRVAYTISIVAMVLESIGGTGGILIRALLVPAWISSLLSGAILAMLYFSPAAVYFEKKTAELK